MKLGPYQFVFIRFMFGLVIAALFLELYLLDVLAFSDFSQGWQPFAKLPLWLQAQGLLNPSLLVMGFISLILAMGFARRWCALFIWFFWMGLFSDMPFWRDLDRIWVPWLLFIMVLATPREPGIRKTETALSWTFQPLLAQLSLYLFTSVQVIQSILLLTVPVEGRYQKLLTDARLDGGLSGMMFLNLPEMVLGMMLRLGPWVAILAAVSMLLPKWRNKGMAITMILWIGSWLFFGANLSLAGIVIMLLLINRQKVAEKGPVVYFDGECGLCNRFVQMLLAEDLKNTLHFSPLQSQYAEKKLGERAEALNTIIVSDDDLVLDRSDAVLHICKALGKPWSWFVVFKFIPRFLRDGLYNIVAKNRLIWFGKLDSCMIPPASVRKRFHQ